MWNAGRLGGSGYVSILPVDQGIEHTAGASFAPTPGYFDPANIVELAIEAGCSGVASTLGILAATARKYAHKIPYIVKLNHNGTDLSRRHTTRFVSGVFNRRLKWVLSV